MRMKYQWIFWLKIYIVLTIIPGNLLGQNNSVIRYSFDNCDVSEDNGFLPSGQIFGDPTCVCGLDGNSYYFDGNDTIIFPGAFSDLFIGDAFTLDIYFTVEPQNGEMDIFSSSASCLKSDSTMYLKYLGSTGELFFLMASNINNILLARTKIDTTVCWHRFTLVKSKTEYFYYLNNELITRFVSRENIPLSRSSPFALGINACSTLGSIPFHGQFDDIVMLNTALSPVEIASSYKYPDQIVTKDTTIYTGSSVTLTLGHSCTPGVTWTPAASLDNAASFAPLASPEESTTYQSFLQFRHCTITDTVRIYVVDKESVDCSKILLPKAFTPNNDGLNDTYGISNLFILENFEFLEIYDRSGSILWKGTEASQQWDGMFGSQAVSSGVYFYKVKYSCGGEEYFVVDTFSVIR